MSSEQPSAVGIIVKDPICSYFFHEILYVVATCKHMNVILKRCDHVFLLNWSDASSWVNDHDIQPRQAFSTLDSRASSVS